MENLANVKNGVLAALSFVFGAVTQALGGWDVALQVLIGCMSVDYITGLVVAAVFQKSNKSESGALESRAGFKGLCRKGGVLCLVFVAAMLDSALGVTYVRPAVCFFFIANEALSILENLGLMGVPYPQSFKNMLQALKDKNDGDLKGDGQNG